MSKTRSRFSVALVMAATFARDWMTPTGTACPDGCDTACPGGEIGDVNLNDVGPFVSALLDPATATADEYCAADANEDGQLNGQDLQGFVNRLLH